MYFIQELFLKSIVIILFLFLLIEGTYAATYDVSIQGNRSFSPDSITINTGDTVRWTNDDTIDIMQTLFINGPSRLPEGLWGRPKGGVWRSDHVNQAKEVAPLEFPWLAPIGR